MFRVAKRIFKKCDWIETWMKRNELWMMIVRYSLGEDILHISDNRVCLGSDMATRNAIAMADRDKERRLAEFDDEAVSRTMSVETLADGSVSTTNTSVSTMRSKGLWSNIHLKWSIIKCLWSVVHLKWSIIKCLWSIVCGCHPSQMVHCLWSVIHLKWSIVCGLPSISNGPLSNVCGLSFI